MSAASPLAPELSTTFPWWFARSETTPSFAPKVIQELACVIYFFGGKDVSRLLAKRVDYAASMTRRDILELTIGSK
jgi:hypothetical protein